MVPAAAAGDVTVICASLSRVKLGAGVLPNLTDGTPPVLNPEPWILTLAPPPGAPAFGVTEVTTGAAR